MAWALRARRLRRSRFPPRATRSRRSAHGAARRGRCAPVCRAAQPLAAIAASRYALGADDVGAARLGACGSQVAASRYALGAKGVGAARPGAYIHVVPPPDNLARVASWWWGCRRRRALRAARDARCKARFALLPRARVWGGDEGWSRHHHLFIWDHARAERAGERLCAAAACAVRVGAERHWDRSAFSPGARPIPRAFFSACVLPSASRISRSPTRPEPCAVRLRGDT